MFPGMGGSMPSTSIMFQYYASFTGLMMMITTAFNTYVPYQVRVYIVSLARRIFFGKKVAPNTLTLAIKEFQGAGGVHNQVFEAAETFLNTKISPTMKGLELSKSAKDKRVSISVNKRSQYIEDDFEGIKLVWTMVGGISSSASNNPPRMRQSMHRSSSDVFFQNPGEGTDESPTRFELSFDEKHYAKVVESYIPYILKKAKELNDANTTLKLWSSGGSDMYGHSSGGGARGGSVNLQHPSTFQTLALDPELKKEIIDDLDRFVKRRDFYTKVGKAWKRGYLLYGPPGTGKSSLVAAMANYLNFDVYDLELTNIRSNSQLRSVLLGSKNRSILLIEDIDCSAEMHDRSKVEHQYDEYGRPYPAKSRNTELTLSGLLNFIDGIWSSCGDERIIIFTTNHKDKLDPALLRPGRMDKHIHMSYITPPGFRILASNYLSVDEHHLFGEIDELIQESQTTPAEVAEELMKSDDTEVSLNGLIQFLKRKILEAKQLEEEEEAQNKLKEEEAQKELKEEIDQKETKDGEPKRTQSSDRYCSKCGSSKPLRRMGGLN